MAGNTLRTAISKGKAILRKRIPNGLPGDERVPSLEMTRGAGEGALTELRLARQCTREPVISRP
jgi:hypothetical protein